MFGIVRCYWDGCLKCSRGILTPFLKLLSEVSSTSCFFWQADGVYPFLREETSGNGGRGKTHKHIIKENGVEVEAAVAHKKNQVKCRNKYKRS